MSGTVTGRIAKINQVTRGWINYYALGSMRTAMAEIDAHLRTRLRVIIWKQWKVPNGTYWWCERGEKFSPTRFQKMYTKKLFLYSVSLCRFEFF